MTPEEERRYDEQFELFEQLRARIDDLLEQDGFPADQINSPENRLRIPTLKHWLITGWYQTKNPDYGDLSPRNYLRGKSWDEHVRVARDAMINLEF
jgi:hypothetical protein